MARVSQESPSHNELWPGCHKGDSAVLLNAQLLCILLHRAHPMSLPEPSSQAYDSLQPHP